MSKSKKHRRSADLYRKVRRAQRRANKLRCSDGCVLHTREEHREMASARRKLLKKAKREVVGAAW